MRRITGVRGQSLVEFALVVPIFFLFVGGIVQFGMIFWGQNTINQIVRDGGRFAATVTDCSGANTAIKTKTEALAAGTILASKVTANAPVLDSSGAPGKDRNGCPTSNSDVVWVTVSASGTVPLFFPWLPGNGTVTSSAQYRVEPVQP